jgi:hypothetical protein
LGIFTNETTVSETVSKSRERVKQNSQQLRAVVLETPTKSGILLETESAMPADSDPRLQSEPTSRQGFRRTGKPMANSLANNLSASLTIVPPFWSIVPE